MLADLWNHLPGWLLFLFASLNLLLVAAFIVWVLMTKTNSTSAVAWCLLLIFLPFVGVCLFLIFGYQHVDRPLQRKRRHRRHYQPPASPQGYAEATRWVAGPPPLSSTNSSLAQLASRFGASSVTGGNAIDIYDDGPAAFESIFAAIEQAKHHIHIETFIFRADGLGRRMIDALTAKAKQGVEVRLLFDAMGSYALSNRVLAPLIAAGGMASTFLSLNPLRRRFQINLRNHRKITVVDGATAFIGGLNVGDEYLGLNRYFGYWRDTHLRVVGPAVYDLQSVFAADWSFATGETLGDGYFRAVTASGPHAMQIIDSGPDQEVKAIREIVFAAILKAKRRLWIASPYFVPDPALLDALCLAAYSGVDVRYLGQLKPDKRIPHFAARYYWPGVMRAGVKIYQFAKGMMHSKVMLVDDEFASVGTANFDNRSMYLNFEVNCLIYCPEIVRSLEASMLRDFADSRQLDAVEFSRRPFVARLVENACRLMSPIL